MLRLKTAAAALLVIAVAAPGCSRNRDVPVDLAPARMANGSVVLDATAGSDAGVDVVSSEYATVAAEQTAAERLSVAGSA